MGKLEDMSKRRATRTPGSWHLNSKVYKAFLEMERAAFGDGELPKQIKELIAVGISVVMNCKAHEQASKAGASKCQVRGCRGWH